jgi:hypothetical protein
MTKTKPCQALKNLIDTNIIDLRTTEWVERVKEEVKEGVIESTIDETS